MNKRVVDSWLSVAYNAIEKCGISEIKDGVKCIQRTYRSQISNFGAAVTMGSIKSAVAFFSQQGKAVADRPKLLQAMYFIISNGDILTPDEIFKWLCSQDQSEVREKFINASVALKLAMNFYKLLPEKNSDNAQKGDAEKMAAEVEGILLWAFEGLQRLVKNGFQFTESDRAKRNRELVKRDNNNVFDFLESEGYIRLKADACTSSKELYEVYKMWCEENSLNAIKSRGFSDALIANQRRYNLESTNNIVNSSGRRVRGFVGIEALVQPDLTPNGWRA